MALKYQNITNPIKATIVRKKKLIYNLQTNFGIKEDLSKKTSIQLVEIYYDLTKDEDAVAFRELYNDPKTRLIYAKEVCGKMQYVKRKKIVTEADKKKRRIEYRAYLKSPEWKKKREKLFAQRGRKCEHCGSGSDLHVHHKTYKTFKREPLNHLEVLCAPCHSAEHKRLRGASKKKVERQRTKLRENKILKRVKVITNKTNFQDFFKY